MTYVYNFSHTLRVQRNQGQIGIILVLPREQNIPEHLEHGRHPTGVCRDNARANLSVSDTMGCTPDTSLGEAVL